MVVAATRAWPVVAQAATKFYQTRTVTATAPVTLNIDLLKADIQVFYSREGEVSITGTAQAISGTPLDQKYFTAVLEVQQKGNEILLHQRGEPVNSEDSIRVQYRIDVPYRTEVTSRVGRGSQTFSGIMGPVTAAGSGSIKASYISRRVRAQLDAGDVDLTVIGEHAEAKTGVGNIFCARAAQGINAETTDGDITLMLVGPSVATVRQGSGRIELGGVRGRIEAVTGTGEIHAKAVPHGDWQLRSVVGSIHLELPPGVKADLEAATELGKLDLLRGDLAPPESSAHHFHAAINGGGARIEALTMSGNIVVR